jgi:hypothetical protein
MHSGVHGCIALPLFVRFCQFGVEHGVVVVSFQSFQSFQSSRGVKRVKRVKR